MIANKCRFAPTPRQRLDGIRHIVYEYANLLSAAYYSMNGRAPWRRTHCDDAFLLGCRKIGDFLMKDRRSKRHGQELDDILALDYLPTKVARHWELPIWSNWQEAMNKQLAHLSYSREKGWDHRLWVPRIEAEFRKAWWCFRDAVVSQEYGEEFDKQLRSCQTKVGFENIPLHRR